MRTSHYNEGRAGSSLNIVNAAEIFAKPGIVAGFEFINKAFLDIRD